MTLRSQLQKAMDDFEGVQKQLQDRATENKALKEALSAKNSPFESEQQREAAMELYQGADTEQFTDVSRKRQRQMSPTSNVATAAPYSQQQIPVSTLPSSKIT